MLMQTHHNGTCCVTICLHVNSLRVIRSTCIYADSSNNAEKPVLTKSLPVINLWGLLIEDIEYLNAYFKTKSIFIRFNSGSGKYTAFKNYAMYIYIYIYILIYWFGTVYGQCSQDKIVRPSAMPVSATWRTSLTVPDLCTSLQSAGAALSRILFKRLFCASRILRLLLLRLQESSALVLR